MNIFSKVAKNKKGATQQNIDGQVVKCRVGRPRREGVRKYGIRLPKELHHKVIAYCEGEGL